MSKQENIKVGTAILLVNNLRTEILNLVDRISINSNVSNNEELAENPDILFSRLKDKIDQYKRVSSSLTTFLVKFRELAWTVSDIRTQTFAVSCLKRIIENIYKSRRANESSDVPSKQTTIVNISSIQEMIDREQEVIINLIECYNADIWSHSISIDPNDIDRRTDNDEDLESNVETTAERPAEPASVAPERPMQRSHTLPQVNNTIILDLINEIVPNGLDFVEDLQPNTEPRLLETEQTNDLTRYRSLFGFADQQT